MKRYSDFLLETPLPEDWDSTIFNPKISFKKRVEYAKERSKRLGTGSSRIAFEIPFEGRLTVLKIAKNNKGISQIEAEEQLLSDWYIRELNLTIPIIDADEINSTWIHTEKAEKVKDNDFRKFFGGTLEDTLKNATWMAGITKSPASYDLVDENSAFYEKISDLSNLIGNYSGYIQWEDFKQIKNWGLWKGNPVIIDLGLTIDVYNTHYKR